ncbi:MAG: hypothetical protein DI539_13870 [Flavobacterium psychrophilum]|nr:MAG: hypothetical protein DI539_13870 [Flavobacterium psychrophilum]
MNSQNKFIFSKSDFISKHENPEMPGWSTFAMVFADNHYQYSFAGMDFYGMHYEYRPFSIELIQIKYYSDPASILFEATGKQTILFIMLEGEIAGGFTKKNNLSMHEGEFTISNYEPGKYNLQPRGDKNSFLLITIDNDWFQYVGEDLINIMNGIINFEDEFADQVFLCKATRQAHQWINNIHAFSHQNIAAVDGNLRMHITFLLEYYKLKIETQKNSLAFKIKKYLDDHYLNNTLSIKNLAEYFHVTERTLRNHFKRQFQKTIHRYYTELRMKRATELINNSSLPLKDIYFHIGYNDESSFRHAYKQYLKKKV